MISDEIKESKLVGFYRASRGSGNPPTFWVGGEVHPSLALCPHVCVITRGGRDTQGDSNTPRPSPLAIPPQAGPGGAVDGATGVGTPDGVCQRRQGALAPPWSPRPRRQGPVCTAPLPSPPLGFQFRTPATAEGSEGPRASPSRRPGATCQRRGPVPHRQPAPIPVNPPSQVNTREGGFRFSDARRNDPKIPYVLDENWESAYHDSPMWGEQWDAAHAQAADWPEGVRILHGKMYIADRLCVPESVSDRLIRSLHVHVGHIGNDRMTKEMRLRFIFPSASQAEKVAAKIRRACDVCQATEPPNWASKGPIRVNPVPERVWASVCMDMFSMPTVEWQGEQFDCFLLCVDRLSGWMLAKPSTKLGLTGEKAAHLMLDGGWGEIGIPAQITSDQGAQFISQWFKTMCARLGVRMAFSQAYRPQANGRAEVAGKTLITTLRKLHFEGAQNWVEALPCALRLIHDRVGEGGVSPYQIVFGRDRNLAGLPYTPTHMCEEASDFLDRMEQLDKVVAATLNRVHESTQNQTNRERTPRDPPKVGDKVWVLRPKGVGGHKVATWWHGPYKISERVGQSSFRVQIRPGILQDVHLDQIKPYVVDEVLGIGKPLTFRREEIGKSPERIVEKIRARRLNDQGESEFLTHWAGTSEAEDTWENAFTFLASCSPVWLDFCWDNNVGVEVVEAMEEQRNLELERCP